MKFVLTPIGSAGDVFPFLGLALRLRERGHQVSMITNGHFQPVIESHGIAFDALGTDEQYRAAISNRDIFHPTRGFKTVISFVAQQRLLLDLIRKQAGADGIVIAHTLAFAARLLQERGELKVISLLLQPGVLRSVHDGPVMMGSHGITRLPRWTQRTIWWLADRLLVDPPVAAILDDLRAELSLPKVRRFLKDWVHSPLLNIGLFPDWYAPIQPDWPDKLRLSSFPLCDWVAQKPADAELLKLLEREKPIVFTPGSGNMHAHAFFEAAAEACRRTGKTGLLLTQHREHLPAQLPAGVYHRDFAPLSQILPMCSGLVHHGGIGTTAAAIAAGIPQIIMPLSHDQPDNAARVVRLNLGARLHPRHFTAKYLAPLLGSITSDTAMRQQCAVRAGQLSQANGLTRTCELIEAACK